MQQLRGLSKADSGGESEPCWRQQRSLIQNISLIFLKYSSFTTVDRKRFAEEISIINRGPTLKTSQIFSDYFIFDQNFQSVS